MRVRDIVAAIDELAPFDLAEDWDHVGLQVGTPDDDVEGVLVTLEADEAALDEAARRDCGVVLAHHPLIFKPLARLTDDDAHARVALRAARERIAVVVCHTNLDKARGGLADIVAELLGLRDAQPLQPAAVDWLKLIAFVPPPDADRVRAALFAAGAGVIGEYEHCSWGVEGQGTFFPTEGASPVIGAPGRDETVTELRLEVVFPRRLRRQVMAAYVTAHPYEEPAFDIVPVENVVSSLGLGRVGRLPEPAPLAELAARVAGALGQPSLRYAGDGDRLVRRVACLPGSGGAAIAAGVAAIADVLVTGDVKYHEARDALDQGLALIDAPHDVTEEAAVLRWSATLGDALAEDGVRVETHRRPGSVWRQSGSALGAALFPKPASPSSATPAPAASAPPPTSKQGAYATAVSPSSPSVSAAPATPDTSAVYRLYTDGGARGNPGPAAIGVRLVAPDGEIMAERGAAIGHATNNVAEYRALVTGLELALEHGVERLTVLVDSQLVQRQVSGSYKVKDRALQALFVEVQRLLRRFDAVEVRHIPREENAEADRLVNEALDRTAGA
jgi:dinuclear metal center YbgI/SA1388 family protein